MAYAPASTNSPFAATGGMAFCRNALSFHESQKGGACSALRRLSHARVEHDGVRVNLVGKPSRVQVSPFGLFVAVTSLLDLAGLKHARSFSRNSHRLRLLPSRGRVACFDLLLPVEQGIRPTHHMQRRGSRPVAAHSLPSQQLFQAVTDRQIHRRRLSSRPSSDGLKTIGKAFADGQNLFARGSKND